MKIRFLLIVLLSFFIATNALADTVPVTFINEVPFSKLGIASLVVENGDYVDYKVLDIEWKDKIKILMLEEGYYGVTLAQERLIIRGDGSVVETIVILGYKDFKVSKDKKNIITFK